MGNVLLIYVELYAGKETFRNEEKEPGEMWALLLVFADKLLKHIIGLAVELFVCSFSQIAYITRNVLAVGNVVPLQAWKPLKLD